MKYFVSFTFFLLFGLIKSSSSVKCHRNEQYKYIRGPDTNECEGDFCYLLYEYTTRSYYQSCFIGQRYAEMGCEFSDNADYLCTCNTDYCNVKNYTLVHNIIPKRRPIYECYNRVSDLTLLGSPSCSISELFDNGHYIGEMYQRNYNEFTLPVVTSGSPLNEFFYDDACYNRTTTRGWQNTCSCLKNKCNLKLPYTVKLGTVDCVQTIEVNFVMQETTCKGTYCFISTIDGFNFNKGCLNLHEEGKYRLQLGYSYMMYTDHYHCDKPYCNQNMTTMGTFIENYQVPKGPPLGTGSSNKGSSQMNLLILTVSLFIFLNIIS